MIQWLKKLYRSPRIRHGVLALGGALSAALVAGGMLPPKVAAGTFLAALLASPSTAIKGSSGRRRTDPNGVPGAVPVDK